jgi:hypothetical protein
MKADDMKEALFNESARITRPAILVDLYEGEIDEPYVPWSRNDEDDSEDENDLDDENDDSGDDEGDE